MRSKKFKHMILYACDVEIGLISLVTFYLHISLCLARVAAARGLVEGGGSIPVISTNDTLFPRGTCQHAETASHFVGGKTTGAEGEVIVRTNRIEGNSEIFWETTPSAEDNPTGVAITDHQQSTLGSATPSTCTEEVAQSISTVVI